MTQKTVWKAWNFPETNAFCDVVMKGGVTSGVLYPQAICRLATRYTLRNIGGTSVGAIAASLAAAAEYRRRKGSGLGYVNLADLSTDITQKNYLLSLFRADPLARPLLKVALQLVGNAPFFLKLLKATFWLTLYYAPVIVATGASCWLILRSLFGEANGGQLAAGVSIGTLLGSIVTVPFAFVCHLVFVLNKSDFGWCHGHMKNSDRFAPAPLTDWLAARIDDAAGMTDRDHALTFGDLYRARVCGEPPPPDERGIDLNMVTTCLSIGRPYMLPFVPETTPKVDDKATDTDPFVPNEPRPGFYFRKDDMDRYFPERIVRQLMAAGSHSAKYSTAKDNVYRFPSASALPVVVAARMSLSFPVLLCAVPLLAPGADGALRNVWFSDGGLTSNFPIHFFDSPLPRWPTFAIDLLSTSPNEKKRKAHVRANYIRKELYQENQVFLESELENGELEPWDRLDRGFTHGNVLAFFSAINDTMRTWNDARVATLSANRQRTVGIRLSADQGGLNLDMPPKTIEHLIELGDEAATTLLRYYPGNDSQMWQDHRFTRYRQTMAGFATWLANFGIGYHRYGSQATYDDLIESNWAIPCEADAALSATQNVGELNARWCANKGDPPWLINEPNPVARFQVRPPY